jgi:hypothetical protein
MSVPPAVADEPIADWRLRIADYKNIGSVIRIPHSAFRIPHSAFRIPHSAMVHK